MSNCVPPVLDRGSGLLLMNAVSMSPLKVMRVLALWAASARAVARTNVRWVGSDVLAYVSE